MQGFQGFLCSIGQHIMANAGVYGTVIVSLFLAAAKSMPVTAPKSFQDLWTWVRETIQTAIPVPRTNSNPTQPSPTSAPTK